MRLVAITAAIIVAGGAYAEGVAPTEVSYGEYGAVDVSLSGASGDPAAGAKVLSERSLGNCVACHQVSALADVPFQGEVGPSLDGAGSRWEEADLRGIVADAKQTFPDSVMPSFYKTTGYIRPGDAYTGKAGVEPLPPLLSAQEIEDVVAFLMTLKDE
ncbi:sulfur oxidation c-type cytochrome SoxX [Roseivivax sp. CAU 1753]